MRDLIEALTIFAKYQPDTRWPTVCSHDVLTIVDVGQLAPTTEDRVRLEALGFFWSEHEEAWQSFRFGSA